MSDPKTEEMSTGQLEREMVERERARHAGEPADARTHERRAERASYLHDKLEERADAEERAEEQDRG